MTSATEYRVELTRQELLMLDGRCGHGVQSIIDGAKLEADLESRLGCHAGIARLAVAAVSEARTEGRLIFRHERIQYCRVCERAAGYAAVKRTTSWHRRKGDVDHSKPLTMGAVELAHRFVRIDKHVAVGCCSECFEAAKPVLAVALANVRAELPEALTGIPSKYRRWGKRRCTACQWQGHEGEMGELPTLFNDGHYRGECPRCGATNAPLGKAIVEQLDGFEVVAA